jgi:hypothetical protein
MINMSNIINQATNLLTLIFSLSISTGTLLATFLFFPGIILLVIALFTKDLSVKTKVRKIGLWLIFLPIGVVVFGFLCFLLFLGLNFFA